jgi:hypothetical protein
VVTWQAKTVVHVLLRTSAENSSRTLLALDSYYHRLLLAFN